MRTRPTPMTLEEFHALPRRPGWKHEYWGGKAYIQPRPSVAIVRAPVVPRPVSIPDGFRLRPATLDDAPPLIHAFFDAFRDSIDYWGYPLPKIRADAHHSITTCFAGRRGAFRSASCLALAPTGRSIAGAALIVEGGEGPNLDLLFVRPRWQRRGLAVALLQFAMNALHEGGETSVDGGYNVANDASAAVHRRLGFEELPDLLRAQDEAYCARHELRRREQEGLTGAERQGLEGRVAHWEAIHAELEATAERDGWVAVSPLLRQRGARKKEETR
ncbi:MAG: GNAT family N-acetyltransferase [Armatimonadota bacterium]|nr:GNAT family N-acetyltransferase [Armatimonadota bacterium]